MMLWVIGTVAVIAGIITVLILRFGLWNLVMRQPDGRSGQLSWEDLGSTPLGEKRFTPQGLTYADGRLIFANSWKNEKSRVYEMNPQDMRVLRSFDMPPEAVHTSGLAYDGRYLWAVDYIANRCYKIDLEISLTSGEAKVSGSFATGLKGTSACGFLQWKGALHLAVSDFMHTRKTYIVRHEQALAHGTMAGDVVFAYANEGFSQGLMWDGRNLYESENKWGINILNKMDLGKLEMTGSVRQATIRQFNAPGWGVEDLAWDGEYIYTSDEKSFRFYRVRLSSQE